MLPGTVSGPGDTLVSKTVQYPCIHAGLNFMYEFLQFINPLAVDRMVRNKESSFSLHLEEANGPFQARAV